MDVIVFVGGGGGGVHIVLVQTKRILTQGEPKKLQKKAKNDGEEPTRYPGKRGALTIAS